MENKTTVNELNDLLQITNDRIKGFHEAANKLGNENSNLKGEYTQMVAASEKMRGDLTSLIMQKGGKPDDSSTVAGGLHRTWVDVKNAFSGDKTESTLENVTFGEKAAVEAYEKAIASGDLCPESTKLVQDQLASLKASHLKFKQLEEMQD